MAYQAVGAGLQLEINIGAATVGLEVICYWDVDECQAGGAVIAVYAYGGISVDVNDPLLGSILAVITDNSSFLTGGTEEGVLALAMMLGTNFSTSVSGVLIFGNERFSSTESYEGSFTSIGGSVGRLKGSVAYADSCTAVSIGGNVVGSNIIPSWGVSKTYYEQIYEKAVGVKSTTNTSNPCSGGCSKVTSGGGRLTSNMMYIV